MKKLIIAMSLAFFGFIANTNAQAPAPAPAQEEVDPNGPKIEFDSLVVDFGTINKGDDPFRVITFKNTGKKPLHITNCAGSCGCTVPQCPTTPIMPGQTAELKVRYDTNRVGPISKKVTVKSNAINGTVYLSVKGKVLDVPVEDTFPANNGSGPVSK